LNSLDKQFALDEQGQITWQKDLTNPMPGEVVAEIKKGEAILKPTCSVVEGETTEGQDKEAVENFIQEWLGRHVKESLEPLFNLQDENLPQGAPQDIAVKLYESLGVITRSEIQDLIAVMDEEQRASLRPKKIRFGPLLVYLPELNKPAAVRLRALLLTLWTRVNYLQPYLLMVLSLFRLRGKSWIKRIINLLAILFMVHVLSVSTCWIV
jgi:ATP-dependent RNA helicase SUPV3L1/SUV3